jgi:hypothetical protein
MFSSAIYDIYADRFVPHSDHVDVVGYDFSSATISMEVRDRRNGGVVRATVTPTVSVTTTLGVPTSRISWTISKSTMATMPVDPVDPNKDVSLHYDVHLSRTSPAITEFIPFKGRFIVVAGVVE